MTDQGMAKVAREKGAAHGSNAEEQPNQKNKFREFVSSPVQWGEERQRRQRSNQSGRTTRGSGEMAGGGTGRQEAAA
jgi:hypothetical protein